MRTPLDKKQFTITTTSPEGREYPVARVILKPYGMTFIPRDMMVGYTNRGTYVRYRKGLKIRMDRFEKLCRDLVDIQETIDVTTFSALAKDRGHNEQREVIERKQ
ncbi:hypothetical protein phi16_gp093 [Corynebacterium phage phi16]|uniref:hypothetical protein n=1 Tax=Corynebacterium glutamicum TaxID=1718 RepID=UPI000942ACC2|nr:hypothetical protein [Corynebacterium glutamicum]APQ42596.1 hypothetical protein phi16_gp093 [Corynebacterium phage phi16]OKX80503.1 hypothetical protein AUO95_10175 [Corynebacterium glutamicum]